jgi:hypothetical protein
MLLFKEKICDDKKEILLLRFDWVTALTGLLDGFPLI